MRRYIFIIILVLGVVIAFLQAGQTAYEYPHDDCLGCHVNIPGEGEAVRLVDSVSRVCGRCHDMTGGVSHYVDIVPSRSAAVPPDMPLDELGSLTCITCHEVHNPLRDAQTGEKTYLLRGPPGRDFCVICHASPGPGTWAFAHQPVMDRAHGFARFEVLNPGGGLDPLSLACLDCHDPLGAPGTTIGSDGSLPRPGDGIGLSHPIGMDYDSFALADKELVSSRDLDGRLMLFDGKLGCCTCHDPYLPGGGPMLVIGGADGFEDLCFACHIK